MKSEIKISSTCTFLIPSIKQFLVGRVMEFLKNDKEDISYHNPWGI